MSTKITSCRMCGSTRLKNEIDLGHMAYTGIFPESKDDRIKEESLKLVSCQNGCGLVQLEDIFNLEVMYGDNYGYRSGLNKSMVSHLRENIEYAKSRVELEENDLIIDIGSNDGTSLNFYDRNLYELVGIDPTAKKFKNYYRDDITVISKFFSENELRNYTHKKAKIITSFSMFYDLPAPLEFSKEVNSIIADNGIWILEQSYLPSMIKALAFDTICHEHLEYYSLKSIIWMADNSNFVLTDFSLNDTNGGSFRIELRKKSINYKNHSENVLKALKEEESFFEANDVFKKFKSDIDIEIKKLKKFIDNTKEKKQLVCALGASTKGNVLLQYLNLDQTDVACIGDVNPYKHGRFTPKTYIPIVSDEEMIKMNPDYAIVLPWHFKQNIIKNYSDKNFKLVFPLPKFEII